jgi:hypothetical protein
VPFNKLAYSWKYDGYPGNTLVTFGLFEEGNKTKLKLTHSGIESLGINNPDFAKENFIEGWKYIIETAIKEFVEKDKYF